MIIHKSSLCGGEISNYFIAIQAHVNERSAIMEYPLFSGKWNSTNCSKKSS
jgi:hypothetical protein